MVQVDPMADALTAIYNAEKVGKKKVQIKPASNLIKSVLLTALKAGYIGEVEEIANRRGGVLQIQLLGRINKCGAIKPRYSVKKDEFEKWEQEYLPARNFGILVISTPEGVMVHTEAQELNIGGRLLAYIY